MNFFTRAFFGDLTKPADILTRRTFSLTAPTYAHNATLQKWASLQTQRRTHVCENMSAVIGGVIV